MEEEYRQAGKTAFKVIAVITILIILGIAVIMYTIPKYSLWAAQYSKKVQVEDALGKKLAATELAAAEVERAKGVAEANRIISTSITEPYLRYLWINGLHDGSSEVIYVPTEANLPLLEARNKR